MTRRVCQIYYRYTTGGCSLSLSIIAGWTMAEVRPAQLAITVTVIGFSYSRIVDSSKSLTVMWWNLPLICELLHFSTHSGGK